MLERQPYRVGTTTFYTTVYLPPGYDRDSRSYPVVYLLHGYGGEDTDWVRYGDAAFIADRLVQGNLIPPTILVMPDGAGAGLEGRRWAFDGRLRRGPLGDQVPSASPPPRC